MDPAGMRRRVKNPNDRGGTEGPVAASTRPPPTEGNGFRRRLRVALIKTVGRGDSRAVLRRRRSDASSRARFPQAETSTKALLTSRRKQKEIQAGSCLLQHELLESIF